MDRRRTYESFGLIETPEADRAPRRWWVGAIIPLGVALAAMTTVTLIMAPTGGGAFLGHSFMLTGVTVVLAGAVAFAAIGDRRRSRLREQRRREIPGEPWKWDHAWDEAGASTSAWPRVMRRSGWLVALAIASAWYDAPMLPASLRWVNWVPAGLVASWWAWHAARALSGGSSHVSYARFPFATGEAVSLRFGVTEGGPHFERVAFYLRLVEEKRGPPGSIRHDVVTTYELADRRPPGLLPGPEQFVELSFDVPARARGTSLSAPLPRYWVLDVVGETSDGPYAESFLVPIYEMPASSTGSGRR